MPQPKHGKRGGAVEQVQGKQTVLRVAAGVCIVLGSGLFEQARQMFLMIAGRREAPNAMFFLGSALMLATLLAGVLLLASKRNENNGLLGQVLLWAGTLALMVQIAMLAPTLEMMKYIFDADISVFLMWVLGRALKLAICFLLFCGAYLVFTGRGVVVGMVVSGVLELCGVVMFAYEFLRCIFTTGFFMNVLLMGLQFAVLPAGMCVWFYTEWVARGKNELPVIADRPSVSFCGVALLSPLVGTVIWALLRLRAPRCAQPVLICAVTGFVLGLALQVFTWIF